MPTDLTIVPTLGHAVAVTQGGPYATGGEGGDAIDLRRLALYGGAPQAGVFGATDWKVSELDAGPAMSVKVRADQGCARVDGGSVTAQGGYVVAPHSAAVELTVPASDVTNPRVDRLVLQVRDGAHDGSGAYDARLRVLAGAPTVGATLDNAAGTTSRAALPTGSVLLAEWVTGANVSSIGNGVIRDRRPWARGAFTRIARGSADYVVTNTAYALLDAANLQPRIECSGVPLKVSLHASQDSPSTGAGYMSLRVDGMQEHEVQTALNNSALGAPLAAKAPLLPAPGSHLIAPYVRSSNGAGWRVRSDSDTQLYFVVEEIVRQNASND